MSQYSLRYLLPSHDVGHLSQQFLYVLILFFVTFCPVFGHLLRIICVGLLHDLRRFLCLDHPVRNGSVYSVAFLHVALELGIVDVFWHLA